MVFSKSINMSPYQPVTEAIMRIVRYQVTNETPRYGWIHEDKVGDIQGDIYGEYRRLEAQTALAEVKLFARAQPGKIICVGRNYAEHAKELGNEVPKVPLIFLKPPSSIIDPDDTILLPPQSQQVEHEGSWWRSSASAGAASLPNRPAIIFWVIPSVTTSLRVTCKGQTASGRAPRVSIRFARSARGSIPSSISRMR